MSATSLRGLSNSQHRLLEAARGFLIPQSGKVERGRRRVLRYFPICQSHLRSTLKTPTDFHATLCQLISAAKRRVYLASLYIGPAANPSSAVRELELLKALQSTTATDVKILLDKNRALRPVPLTVPKSSQYSVGKEISSISSAEACYQALEQKLSRICPSTQDKANNSGVYLLSVLPLWQQILLKNPYNEVAGVFHLKCYIMDDDIILTGANLSEEYFVDRVDRYLWLSDAISLDSRSSISEVSDPSHKSQAGSTENLVEHYAKLIDILCHHAEPYATNRGDYLALYPPRTSKTELVKELTELFTTTVDNFTDAKGAHNESIDGAFIESNETDDELMLNCPVAYVVPTFEAPRGFSRELHNHVPRDSDVIASLIKTAAENAFENHRFFQIRVASAYLNLTDYLVEILGQCNYSSLHLMTAGFTSHGFKPNSKKAGNKGKSWIPAVFDALGRRCAEALQSKYSGCERMTKLWYYQRNGWTYHAKGIWLTESTKDYIHETLDSLSTCIAMTHGSGNYGGRSSFRDLESNLIMVFTEKKNEAAHRFQRMFEDDWNAMCEHAVPVENVKAQPLSFSLRMLLPVIRQFF